MAPKSRDFHEISTFLESNQGASRKLLGHTGLVLECRRASWNDFRASTNGQKIMNFRDFHNFGVSSVIGPVHDFCCTACIARCNGLFRWYWLASTVSERAGKALRVIPRGKQRLTVYRAHQVEIKRACQKLV